MDEQRLREILEQNVEVPVIVDDKLKNTYAQLEGRERPAKRKGLRPVRMALAAAALIGALCVTATAATVMMRQSRIQLIDSEAEKWEVIEKELENQANDPDAPGAVVAGNGFDGAYDYQSTAGDLEDWWNGYGKAFLEEVQGTESDGWTKMRKFQNEDGSIVMRYMGERPSDFISLWEGTPVDLSWLEEHYTLVPGSQRACMYMSSASGKKEGFSFSGEFQGQGDAAFTMIVSQDSRPFAAAAYQVTEGYDHVELYQTGDGAEVLIRIGTSDSGKSVFWANFTAGCSSFYLWGTEMELEDIRAVLDSAKLSNLLEAIPEE